MQIELLMRYGPYIIIALLSLNIWILDMRLEKYKSENLLKDIQVDVISKSLKTSNDELEKIKVDRDSNYIIYNNKIKSLQSELIDVKSKVDKKVSKVVYNSTDKCDMDDKLIKLLKDSFKN